MRRTHTVRWSTLFSLLLAGLLAPASELSAAAGDRLADLVLGQVSQAGLLPNHPDRRSLGVAAGVAVDTSVRPNRLYALDQRHQRILGWRDAENARNGARADLVFGFPHLLLGELAGAAVDAHGNLWVADAGHQRVVMYASPFSTDTEIDFAVPGLHPLPGSCSRHGAADTLCYPEGIAFDGEGTLWVADSLDNRVLGFRDPLASDGVADAVLGQPDFSTIRPSGLPEQVLPFPLGVAADGEGRVYVSANQQLFAYDDPWTPGALPALALGAVSPEDCLAQPGSSLFCRPEGLANDGAGHLFVADTGHCRIVGFDLPLATTAEPRLIPPGQACAGEPGPRDLRRPQNPLALAFDAGGDLYVADGPRVIAFDALVATDDRADRVFGQIDLWHDEIDFPSPAKVYQPMAVAEDRSVSPPRLYVLDARNHRVLGYGDAERLADGAPADLVIGQPDGFTTGCNTGGRSAASLCFALADQNLDDFNEVPQGLAVDGAGNLYVTDGGNNRVLEFDAPFSHDRVADRVFGQGGDFGRGDCDRPLRRSLCMPGAVAVDPAGGLYVADLRHHRVLYFDRPLQSDVLADRVFGQPGFRSGRCGGGLGELCLGAESFAVGQRVSHWGGGLAVDERGSLYVADFYNDRLLLFRAPLAGAALPDRILGGAASGQCLDYGPGLGTLCQPSGLAVDGRGRLWAVDAAVVLRFDDPWHSRRVGVVVGSAFDPDTTYFARVGGVAVEADGDLWATDAYQHKALRFDRP